jgi:DinB family protein
MIATEQTLREHLLYSLKGDGAHVDFATAIKNFPADIRGKRPQGAEHSAWELLEHLRIAQWDILEYIRNRNHVSPEFPAGYWPKSPAPPSDKDWDKSVESFQRDFESVVALVKNESTDLLAPVPHMDGQTVLRKLLMLADHNAYHLGQLVLLRRVLGAWQ